MRQFYIFGQLYTNDFYWWPASSYDGTQGESFSPRLTFSSGMSYYVGHGLLNYRQVSPADNLWLCPENPIHADMIWNSEVREVAFSQASVNVGNYWTTHYFGMSSSSFWSTMVPDHLVPGDRRRQPQLGHRPDRIVWLGELQGVTYTRWRGGGQAIYFHPRQSMNVVTMDGGVHGTQGNWSDEDLRFRE